jgi:single-strand DNA-binding protein
MRRSRDRERGVMKKSEKVKIVETNFEPCNEVLLVGRVSAPASLKELPSGDKVVEFRVIVDRSSSRGKKREVDTLDVAAWSASARKSALAVKAEEWIEVQGAVRRRFWQAPHGLASRWQVEALSITRL